MLNHVEVTNYKSIAHADFALASEVVIVGPNGVGKSNLLDAIHFVRDAARDGLDHAVAKRHGMVSIRRWSKTRPFNIGIKLSFVGPTYSGFYRVLIASAGGEFSILEEEGHWSDSDPMNMMRENKDGGPQSSSFKRIADGSVIFTLPKHPFGDFKPTVPESDLLITQFGQSAYTPLHFFFRALYDETVSCGAYSIYPNKIREPQTISNAEVLADDGTNLASIIRQMRSTSFRVNKEQLTSAIRQVLPIVSEIRIESAGGYYVPVFRVKEQDSGYSHELNMSQLSDGTLRMLGMLTAFYQSRAPQRITLEEPEQMIHPGLLQVLIEAGRDYLDSRVNHQVLYTTHSPILLDMFDTDSIIGATFVDGVSKFSHMSKRQKSIIKDRLFSAGELLVAEGIFE